MNQGEQAVPIDRSAWEARVARAEAPDLSGSLAIDVRLLSAEDLARELGFSVRTIRRLDESGRLPRPVRIGRAVRWRRAEVRAWTEAGCPPREEWIWRVQSN